MSASPERETLSSARTSPGEAKLREVANEVFKSVLIDDLEARAILARLDRAEAALRRIALADLPPGERPADSDWSPSFWQWAPGIARRALDMEPYKPDWGWNGIF